VPEIHLRRRVSIGLLAGHRDMSVSPEWSRPVTRVASKNGRRRPAVSWQELMPRDRRPGSRLAVLAALIIVAWLTGCSSGEPPRGFSERSTIDPHGTEPYTLETAYNTLTHEAAQPTVQRMNTVLGDTAALRDSVITGTAQDADGNALKGVSIYIQPESSGELYQTTTGSDGAYSYSVPEGAYVISAEYDGTSLEPVDSNSVSVPPSAEVNFQMS
jgi:Carboxypeptidase regulatory-like domain